LLSNIGEIKFQYVLNRLGINFLQGWHILEMRHRAISQNDSTKKRNILDLPFKRRKKLKTIAF